MFLAYTLLALAFLLVGAFMVSSMWNRHRDLHAVQVTAADFNGTSWDGSPFVPYTKDKALLEAADFAWLKKAIQNETITIHPCDTDYAQWNVRVIGGTMIAAPGDYIMPTMFGLIVSKHQVQK